MGTVEKYLTGLTIVAVAATLVSSPYTSAVLASIFTGIGNTFNAAKH